MNSGGGIRRGERSRGARQSGEEGTRPAKRIVQLKFGMECDATTSEKWRFSVEAVYRCQCGEHSATRRPKRHNLLRAQIIRFRSRGGAAISPGIAPDYEVLLDKDFRLLHCAGLCRLSPCRFPASYAMLTDTLLQRRLAEQQINPVGIGLVRPDRLYRKGRLGFCPPLPISTPLDMETLNQASRRLLRALLSRNQA
jgi:hypothetical protein